MAMIDPPFFPVATVGGFPRRSRSPPPARSLTRWRSSPAPIPRSRPSAAGRKARPGPAATPRSAYNSLNSFIFTDSSGNDHAVRWSLTPAAQPVSGPARGARQARAELPRNRDYGPHQERSGALDDAGHGRQRWRSDSGPEQGVAARPSQRRGWHAHRRSKIEAEADGPCRDINFDPTVLPNGIRTSDDPFPAARSAAYRVSYDRRTAEEKDYPRTATGAAQ